MKDSLLGLLEELKNKSEERSSLVKRSEELAARFEEKFGHLNFTFWKLIFRVSDNDVSEDYAPAYKYQDEWEILGLSRWASFALMQGAPVFTAYHGIESFLSELGDVWVFVGEQDNQLVILSNYPNRCGLIKAV